MLLRNKPISPAVNPCCNCPISTAGASDVETFDGDREPCGTFSPCFAIACSVTELGKGWWTRLHNVAVNWIACGRGAKFELQIHTGRTISTRELYRHDGNGRNRRRCYRRRSAGMGRIHADPGTATRLARWDLWRSER